MCDNNQENLHGSGHSTDHPEVLEYGDHIEPPFWGTSNVLQWSNDTVFQSMKKELLFRNKWSKLESGSGTAKDDKTDLEKMYDQIQRMASEADLFDSCGFYGFFPVITDDELLIMLDPSDFHTELMTLRFPRMKQSSGRSMSDYFKPTGDIIALQAITIGSKAEEFRQSKCSDLNDRQFGVYFDGLASYCSECMAEKVTTEVRRCFGLERGVGRRFDFGEPGMSAPELKQQLFELLSIEERLGIVLTDQFQIKPNFSLLSIFVHHPAAGRLA
jgi:5-methyltetrahydrofolate--homocysteine methyltransferase